MSGKNLSAKITNHTRRSGFKSVLASVLLVLLGLQASMASVAGLNLGLVDSSPAR